MKQQLQVALLAIAALCLALVFARDFRVKQPGLEPVLRIAANLPLTGDLAVYGTAIQEGVDFASLSVAPETRQLADFRWEDNASNAFQTVTIARRQLAADPNLYLSGVKPQYMAIREILARKKIPHFAWIFDYSIRPQAEPNFRTWVNYKAESPLFINYATKLGASKIAVVYVSVPHSEFQYNDVIIPALKKVEGRKLLVKSYQMDLLDFNTIALSVQQFSPDLIILNGFQHNFLPLVKAFRNLHLIGEGNTIATYDLLDAAPMLSAQELEGIRVSAPQFLLSSDKKLEQWKQSFRSQYGKDPLYTHAYAYDMAKIIFDAATRSSSDSSADDLASAIAATDIPGITGRLVFDEEGDLYPNVALGVYRAGQLVSD